MTPNSLGCFILLLLFLVNLSYPQSVISIGTDIQKMYDSSQFDTVNDSSFLSAVNGALKFSVSFWFQATSSANDSINQALLHLTMLSTSQPWNYASQSTAVRHLSQLIYVERYSSTGIRVYSTDFTTQNTLLTYSISLSQWYHIYVGIDYSQSKHIAYIFNPSNPGSSSANTVVAPAISTPSNEQLDSRTVLYVGGSVDRTSGVLNFNGMLYKVRFMPIFAVQLPDNVLVHQGEIAMSYAFNFNVPCSTYIFSLSNNNVYATFGALETACSDTTDTNEPYFDITSGIQIQPGDYFTINLNNEFVDMNYITFWMRLTSVPGSASILFSILNTSGQIMVNLQVNTSAQLCFNTNLLGSPTCSGSTLTAGVWTNIYCSYSFHSILNYLIVSLLVQNNFWFKNVLIAAYPVVTATNQKIIFGGGVMNAYFMDIQGGQGAFLAVNQLFLDKCYTSVGIASPQCTFCFPGYYLYQGQCQLFCPDGYYRDNSARKCRLCFSSCSSCTGPLENNCVSCSANFPFAFSGYCLNSCPRNSAVSDDKTSCVCDSSCQLCIYNPTANSSDCQTCKDTNQFINGGICVVSEFCPVGTFGNPSTLRCSVTCPPGLTILDYVNRACASFCPKGSVLNSAATQCLLVCPSGQFPASYVGSNANETQFKCTVCSAANHCSTCLSLTQCLSCTTGYLIHEYSGSCVLVASGCNTGYYLNGIVCRVCQTGCTVCPSGYFLKSGSCVTDCGIAYQAASLPAPASCQALLYPVVDISNRSLVNDPDHLPLNIGRTSDLELVGIYYFAGIVSEILWYLDDPTHSQSMKFFANTLDNQLTLIIPKENLLPDTYYSVKLQVIANTRKYGENFIFIQTSSEIVEGVFSISPTTGISGVTLMTASYSLWSHATDTLSYDLTYSRETAITAMGRTFNSKDDYNEIFIASSDQTGSVLFTIPPYVTQREFQVELAVYSANEKVTRTFNVTLAPFNGDRIPLETDVRRFTASSSITYAQYYSLSQKIRYLYGSDKLTDLFTSFNATTLRQNQILNFFPSFCGESVSCSNTGSCGASYYEDWMYSCTCRNDHLGETCSWTDNELLQTVNQIINDVVVDMITRTSTLQLADISTVFLTLRNFSEIGDSLSKKTFRFISQLILAILNLNQSTNPTVPVVFSREEAYYAIIETVSNLLDQASIRPQWRQDERLKHTVRFRSILQLILDNYTANKLSLNLFRTLSYPNTKVLLIQCYGKELFGESLGISGLLSLPTQNIIASLPMSQIIFNQLYTLQIIESSYDFIYPRSNSTASVLHISGLNSLLPITLHFRKTAGFPPLNDDLSSKFLCGYLNTYDFYTTDWTYDSTCSLTKENEFFFTCVCSSLPNLITVLRGTIEYYQDELPDTDTIDLFSSPARLQQYTYLNDNTDNWDDVIPYTTREYYPPSYPTSDIRFKWDQPAFILAIIFIVVYVILAIIHHSCMPEEQKTNNYTTTSRETLLLTYHPFISLGMFGQTQKSHSYHMRLTKFFSLLIASLCMTAAAFYQLTLSLPNITNDTLVMGSAFLGLLLSASWNYLLEGFYFLLNRHCFKESVRNQRIYTIIFFTSMILTTILATYANGYTERDDYGYFFLAFVINLIFDYLLFDMLLLGYAFYDIDSVYLQFFAFRGYYISPNEPINLDLYDITAYKKDKYTDETKDNNDSEVDSLQKDSQKQDDNEQEYFPGVQPLVVENIDDGVGREQELQNLQQQKQQQQAQVRPESAGSKSSKRSNKVVPF